MQQPGVAGPDARLASGQPAEATPLRGVEVLLVVAVWGFYALLNLATELLGGHRDGVPAAPTVGVEAGHVVLPRHLPAAYAVARAIVVEPADAEDVCQDAFVTVNERLAECRPAELFRAWLLRIVRNRAITLRRWQRVRTAAVLGTGPGETDVPATTESPLAAAERTELRARLTAALATLSDAQRTVVLLHDVEAWSHREIGTLLGVAEGTSRATLHVARRRLRARLGVGQPFIQEYAS